ncbi:MAG TPA: TIGR03936 family radical SAM-associated protein [Jatrophihabitans sp.]|nr:TIGR03936 family radical SAM-associated protein [Jatrophihabitans sp.]
MARRTPDAVHVAPVQRLRVQYAKRGRLRFSSHRDFARAFERALRRAEIPMAYSAGFHPHPKISYVGAAPTGVASEAEYLEIALAERREPAAVAGAIDAVLPEGLDIIRVVDAEQCPPGSLSDRIQASRWQLEIAGHPVQLELAVAQFLAATEVPVERLTKDGSRQIDARAAVMSVDVQPGVVSDAASSAGRAIMTMVVRQVTPTVRPDDVLAALRSVAGFAPSEPVRATRLAQGPIDEAADVADPLRTTELYAG